MSPRVLRYAWRVGRASASEISQSAMFRQQSRLLAQLPRNGDHVLLKAQVGLYEPRGDYQLIVESLQEAGDGALAQAFERLKNKLTAEGLFDPAHKQAIPKLPRTVGIITSPTGAAIKDVLSRKL